MAGRELLSEGVYSARWEFSWRGTTMPKTLQDDLWAMIEETKTVLEKRNFKGGWGQNWEVRGDPGAHWE